MGKFALIFSGSVDAAKKCIKDGFNGITYDMDANILINACKDIVMQVKYFIS